MSIRLLTAALGCIALVFGTGAHATESRSETLEDFVDVVPSNLEALTPLTTAGVAFDYNEGKFGASKKSTAASMAPFIRLEWEKVVIRSSLPLFRLEGPFNPVDEDLTETDLGIGDLTSSVSYTFYPPAAGLPFVDAVVKLKFPTATNNFGTEKFDVTLQLDAVHSITDRVAVFADFGYRFRGGAAYRDTMLASVGGGIQAPSRIGIWLAYDWRETPFDERGDEHELVQFLSFPIGEQFRFDPYLVVGLSDASPDWGLGSVFSWTF